MPLPRLELYRSVPALGQKPTYRLIETYMSCDGLRTRVCDGIWHDEDSAITAWVARAAKSEDTPNGNS